MEKNYKNLLSMKKSLRELCEKPFTNEIKFKIAELVREIRKMSREEGDFNKCLAEFSHPL